MDTTDLVIRIIVILLLASFLPFSVISYLRWQLPDKQKRFIEIMNKCKWANSPREPGWIPYSLLVEVGGALDAREVDEQSSLLQKARDEARRDYILPVFFASTAALLGATILLIGPILVDQAFYKISLVLSGPFNTPEFKATALCQSLVNCESKARMLQNLQVSMFAFLGAYIWSLVYIMRRLNVIDLDANAYYNVGIRILLSNFITIIFYLGFEKEILDNFPNWIPAIAFIFGWFPKRVFRYMKEKVFSLFGFKTEEAMVMPLEMIQGAQLFQRTRLSEAGIDDVENLANANLIELLIRTPYNPRLLIDWICQAKLYLLFRDKIFTLREAKIRTIFDFMQVMSDKDARKELLILLPKLLDQKDAIKKKIKVIHPEELIVAWTTCKDDKDLEWLKSARRCLLGLSK